jgi:hypothetical protein
MEGASKQQSEVGDSSVSSAPLTSYGDFRQNPIDNDDLAQLSLSADHISVLLETYFRFATPTYQYLHRPTLEKWANIYVLDEGRLLGTQEACVLLACAQSLLYTKSGDRYVSGGDKDIKLSRCLYGKAKNLLDRESGSPSIASVQARLAMCLYLLSTFRMNECRFCFSFAATIVTSLGLHRRLSSSSTKSCLLEREMRRRTFWCVYVLDGYLSVMLGRPRSFRDEDIDQPYPQNISDVDLLSSEAVDTFDFPLHGNLEAFIGHIDLVKLMGRNNDLLYPLKPLSEDEIVHRTEEMLDALETWCDGLPEFLKPRKRTLTGQRTFERQNTVLKLASAHMRILATRRCLLTDFNHLGRAVPERPQDSRVSHSIQECFTSIMVIIDAVSSLIENSSMHQSFWFTQYIAVVAISTLYVFLVQGVGRWLPGRTDLSLDIEDYFRKAKECQKYLAAVAPEGSQAKRHHQLLDRLRTKAEQDREQNKKRHANQQVVNRSDQVTGAPETVSAAPVLPVTTANFDRNFQPKDFPLPVNSPNSMDEYSLFANQITSGSESEYDFQATWNLGWESLDTIGLLSNSGGYDFSSHKLI